MNQNNTSADSDPWELIWGQPYIDSDRLCSAIERELLADCQQDFRTRLLIRDAVVALESFWGSRKFAKWLERSPVKDSVHAIMREDLGAPGFHNIRSRLVVNVQRNQLEQIFELLSKGISQPTDAYIAGSIPTLIEGLTARPTDDIDFVDEVPLTIREQQATREKIAQQYGFTFGHVQSHYLPKSWQDRLQCFGKFGKLTVYLVDSYDIFVGKLASKQEKHQDDLRVLAAKLDQQKARERLFAYGKDFLASPYDRPTIEENWRFIYREPLLPEPD